MPRICYVKRKLSGSSLAIVEQANKIIEEYAAQGFVLTLRQLYYQFVSRDLIANTQREYKRLGSIINDARLAGLIDWSHLEDRTRNLQSNSHWGSPADIARSAAEGFRVDRWATQPHYVEVFIEKDALAGVFEGVCHELDVPFFSCRGYTSQSEMWAAGRRLRDRMQKRDQQPVILHFGDHDPSGIDMTRDIADRLAMFAETDVQVERLALNMEQIEEHEPPPNPAKATDSRYIEYQRIHGEESWELDALEPTILAGLVRNHIEGLIDQEAWDEAVEREERGQRLLTLAADRWKDVESMLEKGKKK